MTVKIITITNLWTNSLQNLFGNRPDSKEKFRAALNSAEVRKLILDFSCDTFKETDSDVLKATQLVQNIFLTASKHSLKLRKMKPKKKRINLSNKKWFDNECKAKRKFVKKFSNLKHRNPNNLSIRKQYQSEVKEYKTTLQKKRKLFHDNKLHLLENEYDSKNFGTFLNQWTMI